MRPWIGLIPELLLDWVARCKIAVSGREARQAQTCLRWAGRIRTWRMRK